MDLKLYAFEFNSYAVAQNTVYLYVAWNVLGNVGKLPKFRDLHSSKNLQRKGQNDLKSLHICSGTLHFMGLCPAGSLCC